MKTTYSFNNGHYIDDDSLYVIYKLANIGRFAHKNLIDFEYMRPPDKGNSYVGMELREIMNLLDLKINGFIFHKDIFKRYNSKDYEKVEQQIENIKKHNLGMPLEKIFNNKFDYLDFRQPLMTMASLYSWIEFDGILPKDTQNRLDTCLKEYIDAYINEKLEITDTNITIFSQQRNAFDSGFSNEIEKYGTKFIYKANDWYISDLAKKNSFFIHNMLALEFLDFIKIENIYILDYEKDPADQEEIYNAKIIVSEKYKQYLEKKWKGTPYEKNFQKKIINNTKQTNWLKNLNTRSLEKIKAILIITLSELEIIGVDGTKKEYSIVNRVFNKENFSIIEAMDLINNLNRELFIPITAKLNKMGLPTIIILIENPKFLDDWRKLLKEIDNILTGITNTKKVAIFDKDNGILLFQNKKFNFSKKYNQKELLEILFQDAQKNWYYDEVQEKSTFSELLQSKNKPLWRKFYTASDEINKFIAIDLGIKDFILKSTKQIRINPKYV